MHTLSRRFTLALLAALVALTLAACGPEDGRQRGGGVGADVNNKPATVVPRSKVFGGEGHP